MPPKPFAFFGTPYVARDTLAYLASQGYVPEVVVSSPDARRGRGLTLTPSETTAWALECELKVLTPLKIDADFIEEMKGYGCAYAIVVAYGKILPQALIDAFPQGILNIHYSLLPKYRGASPVEGALLAGETETGVTIQQMVYALDAGDVLASETTDIRPDETTRELRPRLVSLGARLLVDMLPAFEAGTLSPVVQDHTQATVTRKIRKEQGELSLTADATTNWNTYRAYAESPGTYTFLEKDGSRIRVKIRTAAFENGVFVPVLVVPEGKNETAYSSLASSGYTPA